MEPKYIVAVVSVGLFAILFLIFFMSLVYRRKTEAKLQAYIHEVYSDKSLLKANYESVSDENSPLPDTRRMAHDGRPVMPSDEQDETTQLKMEDVFGKMEIEGIEEITGNYIP